MFHNLFPHSPPLHIYKQPFEEEKEKKVEREKEMGGEVHRSPGNMSGNMVW